MPARNVKCCFSLATLYIIMCPELILYVKNILYFLLIVLYLIFEVNLMFIPAYTRYRDNFQYTEKLFLVLLTKTDAISVLNWMTLAMQKLTSEGTFRLRLFKLHRLKLWLWANSVLHGFFVVFFFLFTTLQCISIKSINNS